MPCAGKLCASGPGPPWHEPAGRQTSLSVATCCVVASQGAACQGRVWRRVVDAQRPLFGRPPVCAHLSRRRLVSREPPPATAHAVQALVGGNGRRRQGQAGEAGLLLRGGSQAHGRSRRRGRRGAQQRPRCDYMCAINLAALARRWLCAASAVWILPLPASSVRGLPCFLATSLELGALPTNRRRRHCGRGEARQGASGTCWGAAVLTCFRPSLLRTP